MKKFLIKNWFKLGLIMVMLILAGVIFLIGDRDSQNEIKSTLGSKERLDLAVQCREDGESLFQEDKDTASRLRYEKGVLNCYYVEPNFVFNEELNTCLYSGGYSCDLNEKQKDGFLAGTNAKRWERHIIDIYTNKTIVDSWVLNTNDVSELENNRIEEFWGKSEKLGF